MVVNDDLKGTEKLKHLKELKHFNQTLIMPRANFTISAISDNLSGRG